MELYRITLEQVAVNLLESIPSHVLARALVANFSKIATESEITELVTSDFAVSSIFPIATEQEKLYYLYPKPLFHPQISSNIQRIFIKKFKKAKYITEAAYENFKINFQKYLEGTGQFEINNGIFCLADEKPKLEISKYFRPHNTIYRYKKNEEENLVGTEGFFYSSVTIGGKFYFYLSISDKYSKKVITAIRLLCDNGIGGKRSIGYGKFKIKDITPVTLPDPKNEGMLLSSWLPDAQQDAYSENYRIHKYKPLNVTFKDYVQPLKTINYVEAGSIVLNTNTAIIGKNASIAVDDSPNIFIGKALVGGIS